MRIYLSGHLTIEAGDRAAGPERFPGQQGRAVFALLAGERGTPVTRDAVAEAIWPAGPPASWHGALSAIVSKLRGLLADLGLDGNASLVTASGCHELRLPPGTWIDHEAASDAIHEAESALRAGNPAAAYGPSAVAHHITRRPFLASEEGRWFEERRERLGAILLRALECRAEVYLWNREWTLAVDAAREAVTRRPFRESAWRLLMRAHEAAGNRAEALVAYEECRALLREELGTSPDAETRDLHRRMLTER